jgi:glyoxylase-like metal-dependent hydrolase (beta-lactamase superfamily II)
MTTAHPKQTAFERAAEAGVHPIRLWTPFAIGDVNVYLIESAMLTLVDCGPNAGSSLDQLESGLAQRGYALSDVERVVVSHQHIDHVGLAGTILRRSSAEVVCLDILASALEDWPAFAERDDAQAATLMRRHGVPESIVSALYAMSAVVRGWGAEVHVRHPIPDGGSVDLGDRALRLSHRPGHSPSDTVIHDPGNRIAFVGDHLLAGVSSNALISRPLPEGGPTERTCPLVAYRHSLMATRSLDVDLVLTGHGAPISDHLALIDDRLQSQERRASEFLDLLGGGSLSAHEIATLYWGEVAMTQAFLTVSEVLGHLDLLVDDGCVVEDGSDAVVRFQRC